MTEPDRDELVAERVRHLLLLNQWDQAAYQRLVELVDTQEPALGREGFIVLRDLAWKIGPYLNALASALRHFGLSAEDRFVPFTDAQWAESLAHARAARDRLRRHVDGARAAIHIRLTPDKNGFTVTEERDGAAVVHAENVSLQEADALEERLKAAVAERVCEAAYALCDAWGDLPDVQAGPLAAHVSRLAVALKPWFGARVAEAILTKIQRL